MFITNIAILFLKDYVFTCSRSKLTNYTSFLINIWYLASLGTENARYKFCTQAFTVDVTVDTC